MGKEYRPLMNALITAGPSSGVLRTRNARTAERDRQRLHVSTTALTSPRRREALQGSFARQRSRSGQGEGGTDGATLASGGAGSAMCSARNAVSVSRETGAGLTGVKATTPTSTGRWRASTASPRACSGLMNAAEPITCPRGAAGRPSVRPRRAPGRMSDAESDAGPARYRRRAECCRV